ncbi:MAG: CRISPR system precrRNA processing endoribonuclease RAMP protein Cas6 [Candidatus Hydrogenedentes bacterium]|nr:CRISPR system precrRNA processing endoribonuclease RAMP protein Cas6 [Candidatus Hydrogenedentota bacterium]
MLRGSLGHALKKIACALKKNTCIQCPLIEKCAYSICFETPIPKNSEIMKNDNRAPHPYILEPPFESKQQYEIGEPFVCTLTLVGKAHEFLPHFICTLMVMGEQGFGKDRGKAKLITVEQIGRNGNWEIIFDPEKNEYTGKPHFLTEKDIREKYNQLKNYSTYKITYLTPTRIKIKDKFASDGEIKTIIVHLIRRLTLLQYFFCEGEIKKNLSQVIEIARNQLPLSSNFYWKKWLRYSSRQKTKLSMGGFVGEVIYKELPAELLELLIWGENLHIGKGTVFGMGKYEIQPLKD